MCKCFGQYLWTQITISTSYLEDVSAGKLEFQNYYKNKNITQSFFECKKPSNFKINFQTTQYNSIPEVYT